MVVVTDGLSLVVFTVLVLPLVETRVPLTDDLLAGEVVAVDLGVVRVPE